MEARAQSHEAGVARREREREREGERERDREGGRKVCVLTESFKGRVAGRERGRGEEEVSQGRRERERGGSGRLPSAYSQRYLPTYILIIHPTS
jgi:hypothetical protein